jgi:hypothetical protein
VILRGDSGFCRDELMTWCEQQNNVHYVFGMARNERLRKIIAPALAEAAALYRETLRRRVCLPSSRTRRQPARGRASGA